MLLSDIRKRSAVDAAEVAGNIRAFVRALTHLRAATTSGVHTCTVGTSASGVREKHHVAISL